jgi:hypothetical protein
MDDPRFFTKGIFMISIQGTINIRSIQGRYGLFNIGTLVCSLGTFAVKDPSIEEYDPGCYAGVFVIERIRPNSYIADGRMVVEVRATLASIILDLDGDAAPAMPEQLEQDPIEEDRSEAAAIQMAMVAREQDAIANELSGMAPSTRDAELDASILFGHLWPVGRCVKLDPTVGRAKFRQQRDYLSANGYRFVVAQQHWLKEE